MEKTRLNTLTKNFISCILATMILFSFGSCARKLSFMVSKDVPAARGEVKVSRDHNKNYVINVQVYNLAEVERLQSSKQTYVVWMVDDQETTKNIGSLKSSTALFSKQLKASLKTVSSSKPIKIMISAENDPGTQYPGSNVVLSTDRF